MKSTAQSVLQTFVWYISPHNGLWPFYVDGPHRLLQTNSRDALEQMTVNGIAHNLNYGVNFYSVDIHIIYKRGCGPQNTSGGPWVGDLWSKTKRLVIAMICQLHFDIIRPIKNTYLMGHISESLLICALIYVDVILRTKNHTHHKHTSIISHYQDGRPVSKYWYPVSRIEHRTKTQLIYPLKIYKS